MEKQSVSHYLSQLRMKSGGLLAKHQKVNIFVMLLELVMVILGILVYIVSGAYNWLEGLFGTLFLVSMILGILKEWTHPEIQGKTTNLLSACILLFCCERGKSDSDLLSMILMGLGVVVALKGIIMLVQHFIRPAEMRKKHDMPLSVFVMLYGTGIAIIMANISYLSSSEAIFMKTAGIALISEALLKIWNGFQAKDCKKQIIGSAMAGFGIFLFFVYDFFNYSVYSHNVIFYRILILIGLGLEGVFIFLAMKKKSTALKIPMIVMVLACLASAVSTIIMPTRFCTEIIAYICGLMFVSTGVTGLWIDMKT